MGTGEPAGAEQLLAYVTFHFQDALKRIIRDGSKRGKRQGLAQVHGCVVPNDLSLALFVLAGRHALSIEQAEDRFPRGGAEGRLSSELRQARNLTTDILKGDKPIDASWFSDLANGLGADENQRRDLAEGMAKTAPCGSFPSKQRVDADSIASAIGAMVANHAPSGPKVAVLDAVRGTLPLLTSLPDYYPQELELVDLVRPMTVTKIEDVNDLLHGVVTGLYSGSRARGDAVAAFRVIRGEPRVVLLGDPGGGKSSILAGHCVSRIQESEGISLFVRAEDVGALAARLSARTADDAAVAVIQAWDRWRGACSSELELKWLASAIREDVDVLIAIDGLDEITTAENRQGFVTAVRLLEDSCAAIVMASRVTSYTRPQQEFVEYFVDPLPPGRTVSFVEEWFSCGGGRDAEARVLAALEREDLADAAANPLVAGLLCFVGQHSRDSMTGSIAGLYRGFVSLFLQRRWKPEGQRRTGVRELLEAEGDATASAWSMVSVRRDNGVLVWQDAVTLRDLRALSDLDPRVLDLYSVDGLLVPYGPRSQMDPLDQQVRWLHRTIHEHLVGAKLAELVVSDREGVRSWIEHAALRPQWWVALTHMASLLRPVDLAVCVDHLLAASVAAEGPNGDMAVAAAILLLAARSHHRVGEVVERLAAFGCWVWVQKLDARALVAVARAFVDQPTADPVAVQQFWDSCRWVSCDPALYEALGVLAERHQLDATDPDLLPLLRSRFDPNGALGDRVRKAESGQVSWPRGADLASAGDEVVARLLASVRASRTGAEFPFREFEALMSLPDPSIGQGLLADLSARHGIDALRQYAEMGSDPQILECQPMSLGSEAVTELASGILGENLAARVGSRLGELGHPLPLGSSDWARGGHAIGIVMSELGSQGGEGVFDCLGEAEAVDLLRELTVIGAGLEPSHLIRMAEVIRSIDRGNQSLVMVLAIMRFRAWWESGDAVGARLSQVLDCAVPAKVSSRLSLALVEETAVYLVSAVACDEHMRDEQLHSALLLHFQARQELSSQRPEGWEVGFVRSAKRSVEALSHLKRPYASGARGLYTSYFFFGEDLGISAWDEIVDAVVQSQDQMRSPSNAALLLEGLASELHDLDLLPRYFDRIAHSAPRRQHVWSQSVSGNKPGA